LDSSSGDIIRRPPIRLVDGTYVTHGLSALVIQAQVRRLMLGAGTVGCFLTVGIASPLLVTLR
jgi:hypothetical protein